MGKLAPSDSSTKLGGLKRLRDQAKTLTKLSKKSANSITKDKPPATPTANQPDAKHKPARPSAKKRRFL